MHDTQLDSLAIGQVIHRRLCDVESASSSVNGSDSDVGAVERELPASATVGRVESSDRLSASDEGEGGQRAESSEVPCLETIGPR